SVGCKTRCRTTALSGRGWCVAAWPEVVAAPLTRSVRQQVDTVTPTDWDAFINELDEEPLSVSDLLALDIASMPEGIVLTILDNDFPEASVWKEGDQLTTEISEHLYTKYWWHKFSAPVFAEALRRAVTRLSGEGHPFSAQEVESDDEVHLWVRWQVRLPPAARAETVVESIRIAFEMVWERAEAILRDSDSVLLLGKDTGP